MLLPYRDTNVAPSQPRYNFCIATQLPSKRTARRVARAPGRIAGCQAVSWPCRGLLHRVVVRPCAPLRIASQPCPALLCHDTICCIMTQHKLKMGSNPFQTLLFFFFFFFTSFFFLIPTTGKPPIYIYIYIFQFYTL